MNANEKRAAYKPRHQYCRLILANGGKSWAVYLSARANIVDLAIIMNGLGDVMSKRGEYSSGFLVVPRDPKTPAPTPQAFADILARGFDAGVLPLPIMFKRQAQ